MGENVTYANTKILLEYAAIFSVTGNIKNGHVCDFNEI